LTAHLESPSQVKYKASNLAGKKDGLQLRCV
jgi:hypothetical protein